jgi:hypothetical protein
MLVVWLDHPMSRQLLTHYNKSLTGGLELLRGSRRATNDIPQFACRMK